MKIHDLNTYVPKECQKIVLENLSKYMYILIHRQYGKTELAYKIAESELMKKKYKSPLVSITAPTIIQAKVLYEQKFRDNLVPFKPAIIDNKVLKFRRLDNAVCRVEFFGADRFSDSDRGRTTVFNILDEYGSIPQGFAEQTVFPFGDVHDANNFITGTTSKGANHFKYEFELAEKYRSKGNKDYFAIRWTIEDSVKSGDISSSQYERLRKQYDNDRNRHIWLGEYMMDWFAYSLNNIFAQEVSNAHNMGRIGRYPLIPNLPVDTFWDLGLNGTAVWFTQNHAGKIRYFRYIEETKSVHFETFLEKHIIPLGERLKFRYHVFPQDSKQGSDLAVETRFDIAVRRLKGSVIAIKETQKKGQEEFIDQSKRNFDACVFDEEGAGLGVKRLSQYERNKITKKPVKNINSHGADAFVLSHIHLSLYNTPDCAIISSEDEKVFKKHNPFGKKGEIKWWA